MPHFIAQQANYYRLSAKMRRKKEEKIYGPEAYQFNG